MGDIEAPRFADTPEGSRKALLSAVARRPKADEAISPTAGSVGNNDLFADSPVGFAAFYKHLFARRLPRHALREWIIPLYRARRGKKGLVVFAFRGSGKTTTLTIAFTAFRIGQHPHKSNLLIQASDAAAADSAAQIADLIANHPAWKDAFPTIPPDRKAGWGAGGYEVRDTSMAYEAWRAHCAQEKGKDPTFLGLGYQSRAILGKHSTGLLVVDDIHDENNTRSARELHKVGDIVKGTILPTITPTTMQLFVGTPWRANDALAYLAATGQYVTTNTPIYKDVQGPKSYVEARNVTVGAHRRAPDSGEGAAREPVPSEPTLLATRDENSIARIEHPQPQEPDQPCVIASAPLLTIKVTLIDKTSDFGLGMWDGKIPTWPTRFPFSEIERLRRQSGEAEFARMYLLDLKAAEGIHLRREWLNEYPHQDIQPDWPVIMGVDYASTADKLKDDRRDYFAVAIGRALPGGGIVLQDGVRAKVSQGEAEETLRRLAADHPYTMIVGVESVGKGEEFFQLVSRNLDLPWKSMHPGGRGKGDRFESFMGVEFQRKRVWISNVETPFLRAFREEWLAWPRGDHDDTLDAVAWMLEAGSQFLLAQPRGPKPPNPYLSLGRK